MRKIMLTIVLCVVLALMPAIAGLPANNSKTPIPLLKKVRLNQAEDAPFWADGTFQGTWGLREYNWLVDVIDGKNKSGMVEIEIGNISGYYGTILNSVFLMEGTFYPYANESKTSDITGLGLGRLLGGRIGDVEANVSNYNIELKEANYGAFGGFNETSFNYRIMLQKGPTFYMKGDYSKFQ